MNHALRDYLRNLPGPRRILLVGYSGGGTIAVLMARDLPEVIGLVTIGGNLDTDTWTHLHHYSPLSNSLNPATLSPLPPRIHQWHLVGTRDTNVPYEAAKAYLTQPTSGELRLYQGFDHACCWTREWPRAFASIRADLGGR
jgi:dienelactone hydrolase